MKEHSTAKSKNVCSAAHNTLNFFLPFITKKIIELIHKNIKSMHWLKIYKP
jgi:hypothetical protein